jgi:hypothetical protein
MCGTVQVSPVIVILNVTNGVETVPVRFLVFSADDYSAGVCAKIHLQKLLNCELA